MFDRLGTVPALRIDGERIQSNREIARYLERLRPEPPLFPSEPKQRATVEEAEAWGDDVFQMAARRLTFMAVLHGRDGVIDRGNDGRLGPLLWRNETVRSVNSRFAGRVTFAANATGEAELLALLPDMLDRVDGWVETGVLNGEQLNAADFMIAPSLALLDYRPDLREEIDGRPAAGLMNRLLPAP